MHGWVQSSLGMVCRRRATVPYQLALAQLTVLRCGCNCLLMQAAWL